MSFSSIASMLEAAKSADKPLYTIICEDDCQENNYTEEASHRQIQTLWEAMQQSSKQYCASDRSNSGFIGGDAEKLRLAAQAGALIGGTYLLRVIEEALKVAECNACMKRIVAAPTAGSCGVLPAVLLPLTEEKQLDTEVILQALYIAAGFGQVTAIRANVAGAEGGCQAEIGTASAMAAAALTHILGGTADRAMRPCVCDVSRQFARLDLRSGCRTRRDSVRQAQCGRCGQRSQRRQYGARRHHVSYSGRRSH